MVEGKLRKLSQLAQDLLNLLPFSQSSDQYFIDDDLNYVAAPAEKYANQGAAYTTGRPSGQVKLNTGNMDGDGAWLTTLPAGPGINQSRIFKAGFYGFCSNLDDAVYFLGFGTALPTEANPPVEPMDGVYFRSVNGMSAGNWEAVKQDAGVETAIDSGIVTDDVNHLFEIAGDGTNYKFYIDGALVATIAVDITGNTMRMFMVVITQTAGIKELVADRFRISGTREE
jgi:hypothetical protein